MFITPTSPSATPTAVPRRRAWLVMGVGGLVLLVGLVLWLRQRGSTDGPIVVRTMPADQARPSVAPAADPSLEAVPAGVPPADADGDGVSDATERQKGTNLQNPDTDGDGFNDFEELFSRKTNPLQADPPAQYPGAPAGPVGTSGL